MGTPQASLISVTNEIIALSQQLLMQTPNPEASFRYRQNHSVASHSHLAAVVVTPGLRQLSGWASNEGIRARGKVDSACTAEHIGNINRKHNRENDDPYGAGEQSGKRVKPDARSAAANSNAQECATKEPSQPLLSSSRAPAPVPHYPSPLPLSQPAPRPASPLPPPASLPPRLSTPHAPGPLPQAPYYPPPFLSQPAPFVPQFTQYQYPFQMPYYPFHHPSQ
ncbi:hypothetical protein EDB84DRAFT_1573053 [Lactarius hengduanensis]|nr:hypothetical protein EDB84DRAFT_1573053 [Lactarius hengduanensis]